MIIINEISKYVLFLGWFHGLILSLVICVNKPKHKIINLLCLIVLLFSLDILQDWITFQGIKFSNRFLDFFNTPWYILIPPAFISIMSYFIRLRFKKVVIFFSIILFISSIVVKITALIALPSDTLKNTMLRINKFFEVATFPIVVFILYDVFGNFSNTKPHKIKLKEILLQKLRLYFYVASILFLFWIAAIIVFFLTKKEYMYKVFKVFMSLYLYWTTYLFIDWLFYKKYKSKSLNQTLNFKEINNYVLNNKIYTNPYLKISDVSTVFKVSDRVISEILKENGFKNFTEYINILRVREAQGLLRKKVNRKHTIEHIGYLSGFLSKSNFFYSFKKITGTTPSKWAKNDH